MTYLEVLGAFVLPPLLVLLAVVPRDLWCWLLRRTPVAGRRAYLIVLAHVVIAVVYTTPWDNYLVATGTWWYDPQLVTGVVIGWVPIEEYTFFVLQTLLTGLWSVALMRSVLPISRARARPGVRRLMTVLTVAVWLAAMTGLLAGWLPVRYLALILAWALVPVLIQVVFGADILIANWRLLTAAIAPPTIYLWLVDSIALGYGTWVISPTQTIGVRLGLLPLEEMLFLSITNLIIAFGVTLMLSPDSQRRAVTLTDRLRQRRLQGGSQRVTP